MRGRAGPRRGGHNRTSSATEWAVLRLHVDCPHLGIRGLATLLARVEGIALSASTIHAILRRRRDDLAELEAARRQRPRTIVVPARMLRWGLDLTLVWVMGVVPVWVIAVVDLHSSHLLALRPVSPTSVGVVDVLEQLFEQHGRPSAVMTDNGGQFMAGRFRAALRRAGVRHLRIRPGHPWTNGKTERAFRTVKELQRFYAPVTLTPSPGFLVVNSAASSTSSRPSSTSSPQTTPALRRHSLVPAGHVNWARRLGCESGRVAEFVTEFRVQRLIG